MIKIMINTKYSLALAIIISTIVIFATGCSIGIRPRAYEAPPESEAYYEGSYYSPYYDNLPRASTYYYDPGYDPWTMGNYYQSYSGPPRTYGSPESSDSSAQTEKRPVLKGRDSVSASQSQAPNNEQPSLKRERSSARSYDKPNAESSESAINSQKARRDVRRERTQTTQESQKDDNSGAKQRINRSRSENSQNEDEEKKPEE